MKGESSDVNLRSKRLTSVSIAISPAGIYEKKQSALKTRGLEQGWLTEGTVGRDDSNSRTISSNNSAPLPGRFLVREGKFSTNFLLQRTATLLIFLA